MSETGQTFAGLFGTTDFLVPMVLGDLSDAEARERSRDGAGPSIAWTVGHLLFYRQQVLGLLGDERENPYRAFTEPATDGSDYPPVAELLERWTALAPELLTRLASKSDAEWTAPGEGPHGEETLRDQVTFYAWHEGYHVGALGAIRKALGRPGPAELVMAARAAADGGEG